MISSISLFLAIKYVILIVMESPGFNIPKQFISQLEEYTRGYILIVCNEKGELSAYESFDNPVIRLGVVSFTEAHINAIQKHLHNMALREEEKLSGEEDEES